VSERGHARPHFTQQAAVEKLSEAGVAAKLREQLELHLDARDGGSLQSGVSLIREALGPYPERVSERVGDRDA
jgi:hypothetical protein